MKDHWPPEDTFNNKEIVGSADENAFWPILAAHVKMTLYFNFNFYDFFVIFETNHKITWAAEVVFCVFLPGKT